MIEMDEAAFKKAYDAFAGKKSKWAPKWPTKDKLFFAIRTYLAHANKHPNHIGDVNKMVSTQNSAPDCIFGNEDCPKCPTKTRDNGAETLSDI